MRKSQTPSWPVYNELFPYFEDDGHVYIQKDGNDEELSNFTVEPIEELTKDNGVEQTKSFVFCGKLFDHHPLPRVSIPADQFSSLNWIAKNWGLSPSISPKSTSISHFRKYIQNKAIGIPHNTVYTHTGFRRLPGGKLVFLHAGGAIGEEPCLCELESELSRYRLPDVPTHSPKEAFSAVLDLYRLGHKDIIYPLLGFCYLAPLTHFLNEAGVIPSFALYLKGETGSFKTSTANLFMAHFCEYKPFTSGVTNFRATPNYIEKLSFILKDMPLFIDDYHPTTSMEKKKMDAVAQALARGAGDHAGRGRMANDTSLKTTYPPRGISLITGEDLPDIGQSGLARFYTVSFESGAIDLPEIKKFEGKAGLLGEAMFYYIKWLISIEAKLPGKLRERFQTLRQQAEVPGSHARMASNIAWLEVGLSMSYECMIHYKIMDYMDSSAALKEAHQLFIQSGMEQMRLIGNEKPVQKFLTVLEELISSGEILILNIGEALPCNSETVFGYREGDYYLYPDLVFNKVVEFYRRQEGAFPVSKGRLLSDLAKLNMIQTQSGRMTVKKRIRTAQSRMLALKKSALENLE